MRAMAVLAALGTLAACQSQTVMVADQSQAAAVTTAPARPPVRRVVDTSPCRVPAGAGPFEHLANPVRSARLQLPPRAVAEHVNGCAGVRFRIGPDGVPRDLAVMAEYPAGYGFGRAGVALITGSRWAPRDDMAWHYLVMNMHN